MRRALLDARRLFQLWAGHQQAEIETFEPIGLVEQIVAGLRNSAEAKRLSVEVNSEIGEGKVHTGPADAIRQILGAALDNAVKFTPRGKVTVSIRYAGPRVLYVQIQDTGIGIPEDFRDRAFQPFAQASRPVGWPQGGAGLGLAICCAWARAIGAEVGFESVEGEGTRFWLEVPIAPLGSFTPVVLVADDIDVNRMVARRFLEKLGVEVEEAASGLEAVAMADSRSYAMMVIDCSMPDLDGFAAASRIRSESRFNRHTPIVAFSGSSEDSLKSRIASSGMNGVLPKPVRREDFIAMLERWVPGYCYQPQN
ncbi:MAG: response regulator [Bryobacteraceae bacterium]